MAQELFPLTGRTGRDWKGGLEGDSHPNPRPCLSREAALDVSPG